MEGENTNTEHIRESFLPRISVNRPVTVTMILVALMVVGVVAFSRLSIQAYPNGMEWRWMGVSVDYAGASPMEIDRAVRQPIEERMLAVKGYRRIRSSSSASWGMWLGLEFREDADLNLAYNQMVDQLERAKLEIPEEARDFARVRKWNGQEDWEVVWAGVTLPEGAGDPYDFAEKHIVRPLECIDGVARIGVWGAEQREILIELDQEKMRTRGVNHGQLVWSLRNDNFTLSGGNVVEGAKKLYVRSTATYRSLEDIENIPIRVAIGASTSIPGQTGAYGGRSAIQQTGQRERVTADLRLRDVATIAYRVPDRRWYANLNGEPAVSIDVYRESGKNIVEVCKAAIAALDEVAKATGTKFDVFFDQGKMVRGSLANLRNTGLWGGFFAALVLLFFLRTIRMTALITLSIPLCVVIALMGIYVLGWTLNSLTMMGLMLGVGMVVDNAIVIVENIYRLRGEGEEPHRASILGASEVGLAITMATLTTVVVFLPLMLMGVTFVFLLMGVLFESVILPFSVILSIPLAFFGVYWTLWLTNTKMDDMASMGGVVLIGVVVNNAIVLVDMINRLRQTGMERTQAILEAGRNRYRPILMTTFTTVFGLLPMALSTGNMMGMPYAPLGRTMMGGLISSTFLTLLVVPIFYTLLDDFRLALGRIASGAFRGGNEEMNAELVPGDD